MDKGGVGRREGGGGPENWTIFMDDICVSSLKGKTSDVAVHRSSSK